MRSPPCSREKPVDLLRDEALVVRAARAFDASRPTRRGAARHVAASCGLRNVVPGRGAGSTAPPTPATRAGAPRSFSIVRRDPGDDGIAVLRVADRVREHVRERPRAELARAGAASRRTSPGRTRRADRCRARGRWPSERTARSSPRRARRPARRGRAARPRSADQKTAGRSPPGPFRCGSTTWSTNPAAQAASNALPPRSSTAMPVCVTRASASTRRRRTCRAARGAS